MPSLNFIHAISLVGLCLALAGCTTTYDTVDLDRQTKGYHIYCNGMPYMTVNDCYDRAHYICGDQGYEVLKENDATSAHTQMAWDLTTHDILVKCNGVASAMAKSPN